MTRSVAISILLIALMSAGLSLPQQPGWAADEEVDPASITPEALRAALPTLADLVPVEPPPQNWWPGIPSVFESSADPEAAPGQRAVATLRFSREPAYEKPAHLDVTLLAFKNRDSAHAAVRDLAITLGAHGQRQRGPALANDRRYYLFPVTEGFHRTEAVFRTGFLVTRLSLRASEGPFSAGDLGKIARPVLDRVEQLRFGKIAATSLPGDFEKLMPPPRVEFEIGQPRDSRVLQPAHWALMGPGRPEAVMRRLTGAGVSQLYYRRYDITLLPGHTIQATLFACKDAEAASALVQPFREMDLVGGSTLPAGATGPLGTLRLLPQDQSYELQFAKGQYVADVIAQGPPGERIDILCQVFVRTMAERWYTALPAPLTLTN